MNLLHVIASMDPATGGVCGVVRNSIPGLREGGMFSEVASGDAEGKDWQGNDDFPIHLLGPGRFGFAYSSRWVPWLIENLPRFDAVIVHGLWLYHGLGVTQALSWLPAGSPRPSLYVMPHGMLDPYFQRAPERRLKALRNTIYWHLVERHLVNRADALFFTCEEELLLARTTFRGYRPRREINVGYGIQDPPAESCGQIDAFEKVCPLPAGRRILLFLSRIHQKKGIDLLVEAWAQAAPCQPNHLVIAGPGWDTPFGLSIKERIRARGLTNSITCLDMLQGDAKWGAFRCADAFILPSHQENFGIAVVEALACNRPVFISNKVNIWREIQAAGAGVVADDTIEGTLQLVQAWEGDITSNVQTSTFNVQEAISGSLPRRCYEEFFQAQAANRRLAEALSKQPRSASGS